MKSLTARQGRVVVLRTASKLGRWKQAINSIESHSILLKIPAILTEQWAVIFSKETNAVIVLIRLRLKRAGFKETKTFNSDIVFFFFYNLNLLKEGELAKIAKQNGVNEIRVDMKFRQFRLIRQLFWIDYHWYWYTL